MLLRHTPKEIKERKALVINPAKTCQPIGAMYAALGIQGCLPHSVITSYSIHYTKLYEVINPAKTCQPIGAMYAALGIQGCLPHSHGSQGCCAYHRSALTRHYKEPVSASTSSFTEGASVS